MQEDKVASELISAFEPDHDNAFEPSVELTDVDELTMQRFEDELTRTGFGRVLANGHGEIIICWNAYSVKVQFPMRVSSLVHTARACVCGDNRKK